jgi:hypothetical protein
MSLIVLSQCLTIVEDCEEQVRLDDLRDAPRHDEQGHVKALSEREQLSQTMTEEKPAVKDYLTEGFPL